MLERVPSPAPGPEECLLRSEREKTVQKAFDRLPETYRMPLLMQHYQKFSYQEIATALNIPEKTVATRLYRAKMMVKDFLLGGETGGVPSDKKSLVRFLARECTRCEESKITNHLRECDRCSQELEELKAVDRLLNDFGSVQAPPGLLGDIMGAIENTASNSGGIIQLQTNFS